MSTETPEHNESFNWIYCLANRSPSYCTRRIGLKEESKDIQMPRKGFSRERLSSLPLVMVVVGGIHLQESQEHPVVTGGALDLHRGLSRDSKGLLRESGR